jgi:hypothetical protein
MIDSPFEIGLRPVRNELTSVTHGAQARSYVDGGFVDRPAQTKARAGLRRPGLGVDALRRT